MDSRPFRVSQTPEKKPAAAPEPVRVQPEPAQSEEPPVHSSRTSHKPKRSAKRFRLPVIIALLLVVVVAGLVIWSFVRSGATAIDTAKYQAVFFTNGQVYFGKLETFNNGYMRLTDVYYLQTKTDEADTENLQETTTDQNDVQLIKLGDEIHGPEDEMIISKDQILFYENLKEDGKVTQSIDQFKRANAN